MKPSPFLPARHERKGALPLTRSASRAQRQQHRAAQSRAAPRCRRQPRERRVGQPSAGSAPVPGAGRRNDRGELGKPTEPSGSRQRGSHEAVNDAQCAGAISCPVLCWCAGMVEVDAPSLPGQRFRAVPLQHPGCQRSSWAVRHRSAISVSALRASRAAPRARHGSEPGAATRTVPSRAPKPQRFPSPWLPADTQRSDSAS